MPAATSTITITNGTTTVTLTDNTNFSLPLEGWSPQVPTRRTSTLGGRPYTSVVEEIRVNVYGSTAAAAFASLATLVGLIDQAAAWAAGESVNPVTITYQPQGSTQSAALQSLLFGFDGDSPPVNLPVSFNDLLMVYEIPDVSLRFVRDGVWYGAQESLTLVAAVHPSINSGTFAATSSHLTPVKVTLGPLPEELTIGDYDTGFLLIADRSSRLQVLSAETLATPPINDFTTDADAARHPHGTGVLVYTPTGTTEDNTALGAVTIAAGKRIGIVAAVRNSHATTTFQVRVEISGPAERSLATTRPYLVDASTTEPRIVLLGVVLCEEAFANLRLYVTASAAAGVFSCDYLALINLDDPTSRIVAIGPIDVSKSIPTPEESYLTVDPRALTAQTPQVRLIGEDFPTIDYAVPDWYRGDAFLLSSGTTIAAVYCGRNATGGYWGLWDSGGGISPPAAFAFTRRTAFLVPQ